MNLFEPFIGFDANHYYGYFIDALLNNYYIPDYRYITVIYLIKLFF